MFELKRYVLGLFLGLTAGVIFSHPRKDTTNKRWGFFIGHSRNLGKSKLGEGKGLVFSIVFSQNHIKIRLPQFVFKFQYLPNVREELFFVKTLSVYSQSIGS